MSVASNATINEKNLDGMENHLMEAVRPLETARLRRLSGAARLRKNRRNTHDAKNILD
jgi:hypothetical protein